MEELDLKRCLCAYLENKLEFKEYDIFFDALAQIESDILLQWINEILASDIKVYNDERITTLVNFDALQDKINDQILSEFAPNKIISFNTYLYKWIGYTAAILCIVGFSTYLFKQQNSDSPVTFFENNNAYNISAMLPDSSFVILFPNTKIGYALNNSTQTREISHLMGKALYKVKKSTKPFNVNYKDYTTTALGTKFIVDAFVNQYPQIKLLEGKISVRHNGTTDNRPVILENQGLVTIDMAKKVTMQYIFPNTSNVNPERLIEKKIRISAELQGKVQWSSNLLEVKQIKSLEIFKLLEQIYDVTILTGNGDLLNNKFTGSINREGNIEDFLINYCELNGCRFTYKDQIIVINMNQGKEVIR